jgi:hypothetical protein
MVRLRRFGVAITTGAPLRATRASSAAPRASSGRCSIVSSQATPSNAPSRNGRASTSPTTPRSVTPRPAAAVTAERTVPWPMSSETVTRSAARASAMDSAGFGPHPASSTVPRTSASAPATTGWVPASENSGTASGSPRCSSQTPSPRSM